MVSKPTYTHVDAIPHNMIEMGIWRFPYLETRFQKCALTHFSQYDMPYWYISAIYTIVAVRQIASNQIVFGSSDLLCASF